MDLEAQNRACPFFLDLQYLWLLYTCLFRTSVSSLTLFLLHSSFPPHLLNYNRFFFIFTFSCITHIKGYQHTEMCVHTAEHRTRRLVMSTLLLLFDTLQKPRAPTGALAGFRLNKSKENVPSAESTTAEIFKDLGKESPEGTLVPSHTSHEFYILPHISYRLQSIKSQ